MFRKIGWLLAGLWLLIGGLRLLHWALSPSADAVATEPPGLKLKGAYTLAYFVPACRSQETFARLRELGVDADASAVARRAALRSGECTGFERGETVFFEEFSFWSDGARVRKKGELISYWTSYSGLKRSVAGLP